MDGFSNSLLLLSTHQSRPKTTPAWLKIILLMLSLLRVGSKSACQEQHNSAYLGDRTFYASFAPETPTDLYSSSTAITQPCRPTMLNNVGSDLTLINVKRECPVNMAMDITYVALSYVWGGSQPSHCVKSKRESLHIPHSISVDDETIPQTIRDTIRLVEKVGEKYNGVDSLCTCQDDVKNKLSQISNMGNLYSQPFLTIIAASGSDAHAGLVSRNGIG